MGSIIELNDTLVITSFQGFPVDRLNLERHQREPITLEDKFEVVEGPLPLKSKKLKDLEFEFYKEGIRHYHQSPTRCFLVHNIDDLWVYWGHILVTEQTIRIRSNETFGKFQITKIYDRGYQKLATINESPEGKSYF